MQTTSISNSLPTRRPRTLQPPQGIHGNGFAGKLLAQAGGPSSRPPPALTVNVPSPAAENRPSTRTAPTGGGNTNGGYSGGYGIGRSGGRTVPYYSGPRMPNQALAEEQQRYKSLFTNAPAELPGVTVVPAGSGGAAAGDDGAQQQNKSPSAAALGEDGGGAGRSNGRRRRPEAVKIDYHNSVRRRSSNTSFTHPVGHPGGLETLLRSQSRPDSLEGWEDGQTETAAGAAGSRGAARARARAGGKMSVVAAATAADGQEEPFRWIPGAHADRGPVFHSPTGRHRKAGATDPSSGGRVLASHADASGAMGSSGRPGSYRQEASSMNRLAQPRRTATAAAANPSGAQGGSIAGGWALPSSPPSSASASPSASASSFSELPRQLAVPGSLVDEAAATGLASSGVGFAAAGQGRFERPRRGGDGQGGRPQAGGAAGGVGGGALELNNLHPAWRPKGLRRRQRAMSVIERG